MRPCRCSGKGTDPGLSPCAADPGTFHQQCAHPSKRHRLPCPDSLRPAVHSAPSRAQGKSFQPAARTKQKRLGHSAEQRLDSSLRLLSV